jgi:hypothetical protein
MASFNHSCYTIVHDSFFVVYTEGPREIVIPENAKVAVHIYTLPAMHMNVYTLTDYLQTYKDSFHFYMGNNQASILKVITSDVFASCHLSIMNKTTGEVKMCELTFDDESFQRVKNTFNPHKQTGSRAAQQVKKPYKMPTWRAADNTITRSWNPPARNEATKNMKPNVSGKAPTTTGNNRMYPYAKPRRDNDINPLTGKHYLNDGIKTSKGGKNSDDRNKINPFTGKPYLLGNGTKDSKDSKDSKNSNGRNNFNPFTGKGYLLNNGAGSSKGVGSSNGGTLVNKDKAPLFNKSNGDKNDKNDKGKGKAPQVEKEEVDVITIYDSD